MGSLKVMGNFTIRQTAYGVLFAFNSVMSCLIYELMLTGCLPDEATPMTGWSYLRNSSLSKSLAGRFLNAFTDVAHTTLLSNLLGCWHGYLCWARCRFVCSPADTTATHCLLLQEIQIVFGFTFLVLAHPSRPAQNPESRKTVVVAVVITYTTHKSFYCSSGICPELAG